MRALRVLRPLALAAACAALGACGRRAPAPGAELRVLVYNIHAGKDAAGQDNLARVAALARAERADVVLLQEVDRGTRRSGGVDQVALLERASGLHAAFGRTLDYDCGQYGIALLSRWPIADDTLVHLPVTPPQQRTGGSYEPRGALVARLDAPGLALRVLNTHLDASRDDAYRRQEVVAVAAIVRHLVDESSGAPRRLVVAGGDFNSEPASATHAAMLEAGFRDAWTECGRGDSLTYPADHPVKRIDYLWLTGTARCTSAKVLDSQASDHRAVLFTVVP